MTDPAIHSTPFGRAIDAWTKATADVLDAAEAVRGTRVSFEVWNEEVSRPSQATATALFLNIRDGRKNARGAAYGMRALGTTLVDCADYIEAALDEEPSP